MTLARGISVTLLGCLFLMIAGAVVYPSPWMSRQLGRPPVLDVPALIHWDSAEVWTRLSAKLRIENRGGQALVVDNFRMSCGCLTLSQSQDGSLVPVSRLQVDPGGTADLVLDMETRGIPGSGMSQKIAFRTNDPERPEQILTARVGMLTGGVTVVPTGVQFGSLRIGEAVEQVADILDGAAQPRTVASVESSNPSLFEATLFDPAPVEVTAEGKRVGARIGRVRIRCRPTDFGEHQAELRVTIRGREHRPEVAPLRVTVPQAVEALPSVVVLPRVDQGRDVFEAVCLCRSASGTIVDLSLTQVPDGVTARILPADDSPFRRVHISAKPELSGVATILLSGRVESKTHPFSIRVRVISTRPNS